MTRRAKFSVMVVAYLLGVVAVVAVGRGMGTASYGTMLISYQKETLRVNSFSSGLPGKKGGQRLKRKS